MNTTLFYAFMDESGTVGATGTRFLVVAITSTANPRSLEKISRNVFKYALKKFGSAFTANELKAASVDEKIILRLLSEIAREDVMITATIVDQHAIRVPPDDAEEIYQQAAAWTIRRLAEKFPRLNLSVDKRHTNAHLRFLLEATIRNEIEVLPRQNVIIQQEDSVTRKELQAADAVVWAIFQKYEHNDSRFYDIIESKIVDETVVRRKKWN